MLKFEDFYLLNEGNRLMGEFKFGFELEAYWAGVGEGSGRYDEDAWREAVDEWAMNNWRDFRTEAEEYYQDEIIDKASELMGSDFSELIEEIESIFEGGDLETIKKKKFTDDYISDWVGEVIDELEDQWNEEEDDDEDFEQFAKNIIEDKKDGWMESWEDDVRDDYYDKAREEYQDEIRERAEQYASEYAYENDVVSVPEEEATIDDVDKDKLEDFFLDYFDGGDVKSDGSLTSPDETNDVGFEYASSVLQFTPLNLQNLVKLLSDLDDENIYTNSSCGFHVHISFPDMLRKEGFWIQLCLATDEAAQKKFIFGENPLGVKFIQPTYARPDFLKDLADELAAKDWDSLSSTLYDDEKYLVLALTAYKDLEWRGPRNILKFTNDSEENIERAKKFVVLLRDFVKWISDCLDKKDINGVSKNVILASIEQYADIKKSGKRRFQAFDKPKTGKLSGLDKETIRIITTKYPWFLKLNISNYKIFGTVQKLKVKNGRLTGGTWIDGDFYNGYMENIVWQDGLAAECDCENITWKNGNFIGKPDDVYYDRGFRKSTWENGTFEAGNFISSTFKNGIFGGDNQAEVAFIGSHFNGGNWKRGRWIYGDWTGGTWEDGIIMFKNGNDIYECFSDISPAKFFKSMSFDAIMNTKNVTRVTTSRKYNQFTNRLQELS